MSPTLRHLLPDRTVIAMVPVAVCLLAVMVALQASWPSEFDFDPWSARGILPPVMLDAVGWLTLIGSAALSFMALARGRKLGRAAHCVVVVTSAAALSGTGWATHLWAAAHRTSLSDDLLGHLAVPVIGFVPMLVITVVCSVTAELTSGH